MSEDERRRAEEALQRAVDYLNESIAKMAESMMACRAAMERFAEESWRAAVDNQFGDTRPPIPNARITSPSRCRR